MATTQMVEQATRDLAMDNTMEIEPSLSRSDCKILGMKDLERRRFSTTIESVYYYRETTVEGGRTCCAILLSTSFLLGVDEKMALAKVPFTARPPTQSDVNEPIDILDHYPKMEQYLKVGRLSGSTEFHATPVLNVSALGSGVGVSGVGVDKHRVDDQPYLISLSAIRLTLSDQPRRISWEFKDSNGIFYPRTTKLLVIVAKPHHPEGRRRSFPFELRLEKEMRVAIHHVSIINRIMRFLETYQKDDSWCFKIHAPYNATAAKEALADARYADGYKKSPSIVGLHAAAKPWMDAMATAMFIPSSTTNTDDTTTMGQRTQEMMN